MNISNGLYEIYSALSPEFFIGRPVAEDRSLLPKSIVTLPRGNDQSPYPVRIEQCFPLHTYPASLYHLRLMTYFRANEQF